MDPISEIVKKRRAAKRQEFYSQGKKKIDGKWVNIGLAPSTKPRITATGTYNKPTEFQKKVRAEKRKAFAASGYQKQNGEWVRTVKGFK